MMAKNARSLVENQYFPTKSLTSEALVQIDYKMHDVYQEFADHHPDLTAAEVVQRLGYGIHVRFAPLRSRRKLLREFMSSNLAKLYVEMIMERRQLESNGRI
jgi:hypothetical protein